MDRAIAGLRRKIGGEKKRKAKLRKQITRVQGSVDRCIDHLESIEPKSQQDYEGRLRGLRVLCDQEQKFLQTIR